jgi:hypothetical protein
MWQGWLILITGLWLLFGAGIMNVNIESDGYGVDYLLTGILALVLGLWAFLQPVKGLLKVLFGVTGILGIWLGLSAFISALQGTLNYIILGIILIVLGFWTGVSRPSSQSSEAQ